MVGIRSPIRRTSRQAINRFASISRNRPTCRLGFPTALGFLIGILLVAVFRYGVVPYSGKYCMGQRSGNPLNRYESLLLGRARQGQSPSATVDSPLPSSAEQSKFYTDNNLVLIAVMTAKEFLKTRVVAVHNTWEKSIPGQVIFFSSEGSESESPPGIKVIGLRGIDDVYPPQKKVFMMLKYIHDHYLDKFRFFIRADDDVYIKGEELLKFLHSINSSSVPVIGKTGFGNKEDIWRLNLGPDENYCMGGPGMIISREILAKTGPLIRNCLKNELYTVEEDVEVGRCFKHVGNKSCTWSYEHGFYHNFEEPKGSFTHSLRTKDIQRAITLHPVKIPTYAYRLHQYVLDLKTASLRNRLQSLKQQIDNMNHLLNSDETIETSNTRNNVPVNDAIRRTTDDIGEWDFTFYHLYSTRDDNPRRILPTDKRIERQEVYDEILYLMNSKPEDIKYSFLRKHPMYGQEHITGIETEHQEPTNSTSTGNKIVHVFTRRPFVELEFREDIRSIYVESSNPKESRVISQTVASTERVNFILALAGRYSIFLKFIHNFEDVFLKTNENVSLTIMLFRNDPNDTSVDVMTYVTHLKQKYNDSSLSVVLMNGNFSRGVALQNGSRRFQDDDLLFFCDVDLELQSSTLLRIRRNTVKGQTVYAPICFSLYDPQHLPPNISNQYPKELGEKFDLDRGYWRNYGFGMISTYKSDLDRFGGFRQDIKGWGLEDVDLFDKFISANVTVFRSVDVGLLHRFHPIICDRTLEKKQYDQCIGTKVTTSTSPKKMADIVYHTPEILNRNSTR